MTKKQFLSVLTLVIAVAAGSPAAAQKPNTYSQVVVFGDDYSDIGNVNGSQQITQRLLEPNGPVPIDPLLYQVVLPDTVHYWQGRWSNGRVAVEFLADQLGVPLVSFAAGGAMTTTGNYYTWIDPYVSTGALGQIDRYRAEVAGTADPKAMYVIFVSANNFFQLVDWNIVDSTSPPLTSAQVTRAADAAVDDIKISVSKLASMRSTRIMVVGSTDLAQLPWARGENIQGVNFVNDAATFRDRTNARLAAELPRMAKKGVKISYFDHVAASNAIRGNPSVYGLTNLVDACQPGGSTGVFLPACATPDSFYYWDEYRPTSRVSRLIADRMYMTVR